MPEVILDQIEMRRKEKERERERETFVKYLRRIFIHSSTPINVLSSWVHEPPLPRAAVFRHEC